MGNAWGIRGDKFVGNLERVLEIRVEVRYYQDAGNLRLVGLLERLTLPFGADFLPCGDQYHSFHRFVHPCK